MREPDGKPDAHAGDGAEDRGKNEEKLGMAGQLLQPCVAEFGVGHAHCLALGHGQIKAAANGELRDHDMEDCDNADHPARA